MNEGYIKFSCICENDVFSIPDVVLDKINHSRSILKQYDLIGQLPEGIGFGNISIRLNHTNIFLITGSNTGCHPVLALQHIAKINDFLIQKKLVYYDGAAKPSSETMTHAAIYEANSQIRAIVHTHHKATWKKHLHQLPTTDTAYEYGTPEIAGDIKKIVLHNIKQHSGIIIMGGHEDGIITYGQTLKEATELMVTITETAR